MKDNAIFQKFKLNVSNYFYHTISEEKKDDSKVLHYPTVSYFSLYKYSTVFDKLCVCLGMIFCAIASVCSVILFLNVGQLIGVIIDYVSLINSNKAEEKMEAGEEKFWHKMYLFLYTTSSMGVITLISNYLQTFFFNYSALRQICKIKDLFLAKVLDQDISWYDLNGTGDFASRMADDLKKIEEGIGEKASIFLLDFLLVIASVIQGLIKGWKLTLAFLITSPLFVIIMSTVSWMSSKLSVNENEAYGEAGVIAEETISSIKTVIAFDGQKIEQERYNARLLAAQYNNIKRSLINGIGGGILWVLNFASYALCCWYGVKLVLSERHLPTDQVTYTVGNMTTVFFSLLMGQWHFTNLMVFLDCLSVAKGAASKIFAIIDTKPKINASKGNGLRPEKMPGRISFHNVCFRYPSRPEVQILSNFNLSVAPGETVALVGSSGCGKTTCIQLVQRYYDPDEGNIYIDGNNIKDLDLNWLRSNIGVVGQEPILFEATIEENIRLGRKDATMEDIVGAAEKVNAHSFVSSLPNGYETLVGEKGAQLSGGQKQRIAIARALVRKPSILLLDEATSALDSTSEAIIQAALDTESKKCTTIIVAHRLSTIRNADRILVISEGKVVEEGSHDLLMSLHGAYYKLVTLQVQATESYEERAPTATDTVPSKFFERRGSKEDVELDLRPGEDVKGVENTTSALMNIMKFNSPEWWIILIGSIGSIVMGVETNIFTIIVGNILSALSNTNDDIVQDTANELVICFLILGVIVGISSLLQVYMFGIAGEKLTMRLRSTMFKTMLSQEMAWFDDRNNGVGSLCAQLSGEAAIVHGATGQRIGIILQVISSIATTIGVGFYYEWRIALIMSCFCPLITAFLVIEQKLMAKENLQENTSLQRSMRIAVEGISNIRTVASLGCEETFHDLYIAELKPYQTVAIRNTHYRGIILGLSRSLIYYAYVAGLFYGAILIKKGEAEFINVYVAVDGFVRSTWVLSHALIFTPNFRKGLAAANRIFNLLMRHPPVLDESGSKDEQWDEGNVTYKHVHFAYPNRPSIKVLRDLNLSVLKGKRVALVGHSGCGKSTVIQLLQRFYDPDRGVICMDEKNIQEIPVSALRSRLGIVSQEPNLFGKTIAENIAYGDNSRTVTLEEIVEAAKRANVHNFIVSLPLGYDTKLGEKGTQFSGGQKQRVAIARALIRNPKLLLLDEATSALDAESEKVVQEALDDVQIGRTCLTIAHRLSTIKDADVICVLNQGMVTEIGTHTELLDLKGLYYSLYNLQKM